MTEFIKKERKKHSGYCKGNWKNTGALNFKNDIFKVMNKGELAVVADHSKAFYILDYKILITKLQCKMVKTST